MHKDTLKTIENKPKKECSINKKQQNNLAGLNNEFKKELIEVDYSFLPDKKTQKQKNTGYLYFKSSESTLNNQRKLNESNIYKAKKSKKKTNKQLFGNLSISKVQIGIIKSI